MTAKQPLFLRIFKDEKLLDVKQFTTEQIVIGREGNVDVLLSDDSISPIHAMIEERQGLYYICDLGSTTGTFVGGERVIDHLLQSGSEFQIGGLKIEFYIGIPRPKKTAPAVTPETTGVTEVDLPPPPPPEKKTTRWLSAKHPFTRNRLFHLRLWLQPR